MSPYKPKPPTSPTTRPPRLRQIRTQIKPRSKRPDIWSDFARTYEKDRRRRGFKLIRDVCSMAQDEAEISYIADRSQADGKSFRDRAKNVAALSEKLLAALMPEKDELVPIGTPFDDVDGLTIGERSRIVDSVHNCISDLYLRETCVPDLQDVFSRPDGTADGHSVFGASDPVDIGSLLKQLALLHRRATAAATNPIESIWGKKQPGTVFLETICMYLDELEPVLSVSGKARYVTSSGLPTGWLPDFLRAAETRAIHDGVLGLPSPVSDGTIKNVCLNAIRAT